MPNIRSDIVDVYPFRRVSDGDVEFLLLLRAPHTRLGGSWQAVHGHIEVGESAFQAALRELAEETALTPMACWQLERLNAFFSAVDDCVMLCPGFAVEIDPRAEVRLSAEHSEWQWLSAVDAQRTLPWPGQRQALREILTEIIPGGTVAETLRLQPPSR